MAWVRSDDCEGGACVEVEPKVEVPGAASVFIKSTYCETGACVEVGVSDTTHLVLSPDCNSPQCAQAACGCLKDVHGDGIRGTVGLEHLPDGGVAVFLSTNPGVKLRYTKDEWDAFVKGARRGQFDLPRLIAAQV